MTERVDQPLIVQALLAPATTAGLTATGWDLLVRQGRSSNLLARLAEQLQALALLDRK
jgi:hypothetical protein